MPPSEATVPNEALLRLLFEQAPGFMAVLEGPRHVFSLTNRAYAKLLGERELVGRAVRDAVPEVVDQGFLGILDKVYASGEAYVGETAPISLQREGGEAPELRYLDFVYQPIFARDGAVAGIFVQGHDVTERVLAEASVRAETRALDSQRRIFDTVLNAISDFAYILDAEGRFTYVNRALLALWGMEMKDAQGKSFRELPYDATLAERLCDEVAQVFRSGEVYIGRTEYTNPAGSSAWYEYIFNPVFDAEGEVIFVAGSTRDITATTRQEAQTRQLIEAERAARNQAERAGHIKDGFLANLSHELRTPLNAILGWAELLSTGKVEPDKVPEAARRIRRNVKLQAQLISDLLDVSGIVSGKLRLLSDPVDVAEQISQAIEGLALEARTKGVELRGDTSVEALVIGDASRLQQVFWNLLSNAIKFTPAGGSISVDLRVADGVVTATVKDTGIGLAPEFLPHLFERFSQSDSSSTRRYGGLGLGLSIVKSLVTLHGGEVRATSAGLNQGTSFEVTLPMAVGVNTPAPSDTADRPSDASQRLDGVRILIVDDDGDGREVIRRFLQSYGSDVRIAANAEQALQALDTFSPELLVSDISMPGMDGYELMKRIRALPAPAGRLRAVALTAFARDQDADKAHAAGFDAHVAKPVEPAALLQECLRCLSRMR